MSSKVVSVIMCFMLSGFIVAEAQLIDHWETAVYNKDIWRFFVGSSEPSSEWNSLNFDDGQWNSGMGGFGYGDGDDNTLINPTVSVYIRHKFDLVDTSTLHYGVFHADYDDAFVAYLNGVEIARRNIGTVGISPSYDQTANNSHEAVLYQDGLPDVFLVSDSTLKTLIKEGDNVLAVQIHNTSIISFDLSSNFFLSFGISDESMSYGETPDWFYTPLISSNLPLVIINTIETSEIFDEPRVPAHMGIINNGPGQRNYLSDDYNHYDGLISIEIRGASSQSFPKKNYGFETQTEDGENNNVSLLGMPEENDWILHGPYSDKSLLRNLLTFHMGRSTDRYAPRTELCELIINEDYRGVYILTERIKQDKNRVDIANLKEEDISGDELTGGYILQIDRDDQEIDEDGWHSSYPAFVFYAFDDPDFDKLVPVQKEYIRDYINEFEENLDSPDYEDSYSDYVDVPSYVDYFLITEIGKHIDAYRLSFFLYKEKDSDGGKLHFGPLWDFNLGYGNFNYLCSPDPDGWSYLFGDDCTPYMPFWVKKLIEIPDVSNLTNCRWSELRSGALQTDSLMQLIDQNAALLEEANERNFNRWNILGTYVWPNDFVGESYQEEILFLKDWLTQRLAWMDDNMIGECDSLVHTNILVSSLVSKVYPNPATDKLYIELKDNNSMELTIQIFDQVGKQMQVEVISDRFSLIELNDFPSGLYVYSISNGGSKIETGKLNIINLE